MATPNLDLDFLATVFDVDRIGICVVDGAGRFVRVNPAFSTLVDYRPDELIGQHYSICAPPSVVEAKDKFLAALLADSPKIPSEWRIRRKDCGLFDALVSFRPITRPDGGQFVVITFSDITESKRAQAQIDLPMPAMNGDAVLAALRSDVATAATPFIFLTASADKHEREARLRSGGNDYLVKPVDFNELLAAIRRHLPGDPSQG